MLTEGFDVNKQNNKTYPSAVFRLYTPESLQANEETAIYLRLFFFLFSLPCTLVSFFAFSIFANRTAHHTRANSTPCYLTGVLSSFLLLSLLPATFAAFCLYFLYLVIYFTFPIEHSGAYVKQYFLSCIYDDNHQNLILMAFVHVTFS